MKTNIRILILLILSGCSTLDLSRIAPGYVEAFKSIDRLINGYEDNSISFEVIKNIPYASLLMSIGKGPKGLMILESMNDNQSVWVSADEVYIIKDNGKIIQTKGLSNNLDEILYTVNFSDLLNVNTNTTFIYYVSFSEPKLSNLKLKANFTKKERKLVNLLNGKVFLTLIEEEVSSMDLGWKEVNQYWVDDKSYIWKSTQSITPKIPKLFIEVTKKPSK